MPDPLALLKRPRPGMLNLEPLPTPADRMNAKPGPYRTSLNPVDELEFQGWLRSKNVPYEDTPAADYDMRGFWQAMKTKDPRATQAYNPFDASMHFPDVWKTPYHKTFSNESVYALPTAPGWQGERLVNSLGRTVADESKKK